LTEQEGKLLEDLRELGPGWQPPVKAEFEGYGGELRGSTGAFAVERPGFPEILLELAPSGKNARVMVHRFTFDSVDRAQVIPMVEKLLTGDYILDRRWVFGRSLRLRVQLSDHWEEAITGLGVMPLADWELRALNKG
jgi:hypothetical protein